jgi:hypothetical protein
MTEGIFFADAELPFHVWVRERRGDEGYRWVLRETRSAQEAGARAAEPKGDRAEGDSPPVETPA